jgi:predicted protein tyrosine phosphatase
MEVLILSRDKIEEMARGGFAEHTAVISITDVQWTFAELKHKPEFLLQVAFDDVDEDIFLDVFGGMLTDKERAKIESKYKMFTDTQANQIAEFYLSIKDKAEVLICQCEHGQSRSAAVAAAIMEYRSKRGIDVFAADEYYPNKRIFRKVLKALTDFNL